MDKKLLAIELKKPGYEKLKGGQEIKAERFKQKEYIEHYVISDLGAFFLKTMEFVRCSIKPLECKIESMSSLKKAELKKWLDKNQIGYKDE
jgi:hypothetical protein